MLLKCLEEGCNETFNRKVAFKIHLRADHKITVEEEELKFPTLPEYREWFEQIIRKGYVRTNVAKYGDYNTRYYGCRSVIRDKGVCTSSAIVTSHAQGNVTVKYIKTHYGHAELQNDGSMVENDGSMDENSVSRIAAMLLTAPSSKDESVNSIRCLEGCNTSFRRKTGLISHLKDIHNVPIELHNYTFTSISEFDQWLLIEKDLNNVDYVRTRGKRKCDNGSVIYYNCAEFEEPHVQDPVDRKRKPKKERSNACTSYLKVTTLNEGGVLVQYIKTHYGHEKETRNVSSTTNIYKVTETHYDHMKEIQNVSKVTETHYDHMKEIQNVSSTSSYKTSAHYQHLEEIHDVVVPHSNYETIPIEHYETGDDLRTKLIRETSVLLDLLKSTSDLNKLSAVQKCIKEAISVYENDVTKMDPYLERPLMRQDEINGNCITQPVSQPYYSMNGFLL